MAHYARINALTHKVDQVIVADAEFISKLPDRDFWIKTSYNMRGGVYYDPETNQPADDQSVIDGDEARERKNYAGLAIPIARIEMRSYRHSRSLAGRLTKTPACGKRPYRCRMMASRINGTKKHNLGMR